VVQVLRVLRPFEYDFFEVEDEVIEFTKDEGYEREEKRKVPRSLSVRFMDVAWSLLEDSRKHWTRFKQYFVILKEFAAMGHQQRKFYLNRRFFEVMNDWFMGQPKRSRSRVSVMDNFNFPDLVEFVSLLSIVVRGCENGSSVAEKGYPPTTICDGEVHRISESEVKELYDQTFFVAMMKMDYNREAAIEIVLHSCWENLQRSKKIIDYILSGLNNYSEKMLMLKAILTFVLQMTDSLQESRLKIAFGSSNNGLFSLMRDRQSTRISYAIIKVRFPFPSIIPSSQFSVTMPSV
jgi:hypothetical protein